MRKLLFTMLCMLGICSAAFAYNTSAVLLVHNGSATTYQPEQMADAMNDAEDGDEVYLNEGSFPAFTISKKISVKGVGEKTVIKGDITLLVPDNTTLTENLLEYLNIEGCVRLNTETRGASIKQCTMASIDFAADTHDSFIDRCYIKNTMYANNIISETVTDEDGHTFTVTNPRIKGLTVTNSRIYYVQGIEQYTGSSESLGINQNTTFINCVISHLGHCGGTIINSIVNENEYLRWGSFYGCTIYNTILINTYTYSYYNKIGEYGYDCVKTNCYSGEKALSYTADLASLGYFGNDGTIIGPLGGSTPYTLEPAVPKVTGSTLKVDTEKKQLNVTLTVSPE